jgi:hypothetical protein
MTVQISADERATEARQHFFHTLPSGRVGWNFTQDTLLAQTYIAEQRARGGVVTARYWPAEWQAIVEITRPGVWMILGVWNLFSKDEQPWWQQLGLSFAEVVPV